MGANGSSPWAMASEGTETTNATEVTTPTMVSIPVAAATRILGPGGSSVALRATAVSREINLGGRRRRSAMDDVGAGSTLRATRATLDVYSRGELSLAAVASDASSQNLRCWEMRYRTTG